MHLQQPSRCDVDSKMCHAIKRERSRKHANKKNKWHALLQNVAWADFWALILGQPVLFDILKGRDTIERKRIYYLGIAAGEYQSSNIINLVSARWGGLGWDETSWQLLYTADWKFDSDNAENWFRQFLLITTLYLLGYNCHTWHVSVKSRQRRIR